MIDTESPDYLAGLAAGRRSFLLSVHHCIPGRPTSVLVSNMELPPLMHIDFNHLNLVIGQVSILITDRLPESETYPDQDD